MPSSIDPDTPPLRWWHQALRISDIQVTPEEMRDMTPAGLAAVQAEMGFNLQHLAFPTLSGGEGTFLRGPWQPEEYRAYLRECHQRGIRVVPYTNVHWIIEPFSSEHPDWLQVDEQGTPIVLGYGKGNAPCMNTPWRDWAIAQVLGFLDEYDIDGLYLDGPTYFPRACYCAACRQLFATEEHAALPAWADRQDAAWPLFVAFRAASLARFVQDLRAAVKARKPDALLYMNNATLGVNWPSSRDTRALAPHLDTLGSERANLFRGPALLDPYWMPGAAMHLLETQSLTADGGPLPAPKSGVRRKPISLTVCFRHLPWDYYELPPAELRLFIAGGIAGGANMKVMGGLRFMSPAVREAVTDLLHFYRDHAGTLVGTRSLARTAVLWPQRTIDFGGSWWSGVRGEWERLVQDEFCGVYEALLRSQTPLDVLDEPALAGLTPEHYTALALPNAECLGDAEVDALRAYVQQGGHLLLTGFPGVADADGRSREDFALAELMGLAKTGIHDRLPFDYLQVSTDDERTAGCHPLLPAPEYAPQARPVDATVLGSFYDKLPSRYFPLNLAAHAPVGLAVKRFGQGSCATFLGAVGAAYWRQRFPDYQTLLSRLTRGGSPPLIVVANVGSAVEVSHRYQPATGEHIVHLLNHAGDMERPRRRIIPVHDVSVSLQDASLAHARALRSGHSLDVRRAGAGVQVTLPTLGDYEVLMFS